MTAAPRSGRDVGRRRRATGRLPLCLAILLCGACVAGSASDAAARAASSSSSAAADVSGQAAPAVHDPDPWEKANRGIFWFNETADIYVILPVAKAWRFVFPRPVRSAIRNVSDLSRMSVVLANNMLQLQPRKANDDVFRIVINASFGIGGLIDVATMVDVPEHDEDFGQTLGFWGTPPGPYVMLPIFGPANVRDGFGRAVDAFGTLYSYWLPLRWLSVIVNAAELLNLRARYIEEIDENRRESFDYYVFLRDAYLQNRRTKVDRSIWLGARDDTEADEDFYFMDDDDYDDEYESDHEAYDANDEETPPAREHPDAED